MVRWLIIVLLVSVMGLLLAAAGVARHILQQRRLSNKSQRADASVAQAAGRSDMESES